MASKSVTVPLDVTSCPICFEVPPGNVFQCKNSHIYCSVCATRLKRCPECSVMFGKTPMRNRAFEGILDAATFPCSNENCTEFYKREDLQRHQRVCQFGSVNVCSNLGYECQMTVDNKDKLFSHLLVVHDTEYHDSEYHRGFKNFIADYVKSGRFQCWADMLNCVDGNYIVNTQLSFKKDETGPGLNGVLSFAVLSLDGDGKHDAKYRASLIIVARYKSKEVRISSWEGYPIYFKSVASDICPFLSLPVNFLKHTVECEAEEVVREFDLVVKVQMTGNDGKKEARIRIEF